MWAPVTAGPGGEMGAGAGRGHLRASRAEREDLIETLKAAFVLGLLDKDEFGARVGQTLASRTYADLAAVTADIPAGLADGLPPRETAPVQAAHPPMSKAATCFIGACVIVPPALLAVALLVRSDALFHLMVPVMIVYVMGWVVGVAQMFDTWQQKHSPRQPPQRPARP
jgi:Domain of unknown function (DUF1707)